MNGKSLLLALMTLVGSLATNAPAAPVTYWFSGIVESVNNPSNAMPFNVSVGAPFTAQLSYDPDFIGYSNLNSYPEGNVGSYYFNNAAGYSIIFQIAGHTITNTAREGYFSGSIGVYDQYNNSDSYWTDSGKALNVDGIPFLAAPLFSVISIYLSDDTKTAFNSAALPTNAPALDQLATQRQLTWGAYIDDGKPTRLFSIGGVLTSVTLTEQVQLNVRPASASTLQLGWPVTTSGFTLQSSTNLAITNWQTVTTPVVDINVEHTVTVSPDYPARFFRLIK